MEGPHNLESRESIIGKLLERFAEKEGVEVDELLEYMIGFAEIVNEDEDARPYFEIMAESIKEHFSEEVTPDELIEYAQNL